MDKITEITSIIECDLLNISEWLAQNKLKLNIEKTKMLVISKCKSNKYTENVVVKIGDSNVKRVTEMKILGITFDEKMTFNAHVKTLSKKCYGSLAKLYSIKHALSKENKVTLVKSLVLPVLNYGCLIWLSSSNKIIYKKYDKIIRSVSRFILGKRKYDSVSSEICNELGFLFAKHKYLYELLLFTYKCAYQTKSGLFTNYINFSYEPTQSTRNNSFYAPSIKVNCKWGTCSLRYAAVNEWLKINNTVRNSVGKQSEFKAAVFNFCMDMQEKLFLTPISDDIDDFICDIGSLF
jgi:hypothetical protein